MSKKRKVLDEAMQLTIAEKADVVDKLIRNLNEPDQKIDDLWRKEAEERVEAFESGELKSVSLQEVMEKYKAEF